MSLKRWVAAVGAALALASPAGAGTFESNDAQLNAIWAASVKTATDMLAPGGQLLDVYDRPCPTPLGEQVILDGVARDRCPYIGDESVIDAVFDTVDPHFDVQRNMLAWFVGGQHADGAIPASPAGWVLFDYNAYWLMVLHRYVLYSGDIGFARTLWPRVMRLVNGWYRGRVGPDGLLWSNDLQGLDYAFIPRHGDQVAYFNTQAVVALREAAELARWVGSDEATGWDEMADEIAVASERFWDPAVGAFTDTLTDRTTHPQDGNAFAVLAGVGTLDEQKSALAYTAGFAHSWGNGMADTEVWDTPAWGRFAKLRSYPFMAYYDVLARYAIGDEAGAIDELRREWGYMLANGPQSTFWETIGPYGGGPVAQWQSWDAGWSAGAGPVLTEEVLGVRPTSPGFATFTVTPHPSGLEWAKGDVPTPNGEITVSWTITDEKLALNVTAPPGERWENQPTRTAAASATVAPELVSEHGKGQA
jgi:hypothetical protein